MTIKELLHVVKPYQDIILIDDRKVEIYGGIAAGVPEMLHKHLVEDITAMSTSKSLLVSCRY